MAEAAQPVQHFVAHLRHRFGQTLQGAHVLERLGLGDEGAFAVNLEDQALLLQIAQGLTHSDAADVERFAQFAFRGHAAVGGVGAVEYALAQQFLELGVERYR
ncbi:hypothetical protein D3C81_922750 [compost metagenome]